MLSPVANIPLAILAFLLFDLCSEPNVRAGKAGKIPPRPLFCGLWRSRKVCPGLAVMLTSYSRSGDPAITRDETNQTWIALSSWGEPVQNIGKGLLEPSSEVPLSKHASRTNWHQILQKHPHHSNAPSLWQPTPLHSTPFPYWIPQPFLAMTLFQPVIFSIKHLLFSHFSSFSVACSVSPALNPAQDMASSCNFLLVQFPLGPPCATGHTWRRHLIPIHGGNREESQK